MKNLGVFVMYSVFSVLLGICIGCSPLASNKILKIIVMAVTGG